MVSSIFTPNRRIDYYRKLSQALMPKEIRAFDPNIRNPYAQGTGTNIANVLQGLAQTYFAQDPLRKADRLETEQRAAQAEIYGNLSQAGRARTPAGGQYFEQVQAPVPGIPPEFAQGPGATQTQIRRVAIGDDGREVPASAVSAETAQIAGIDLAQYKAMRDEARMKGDAATQEAIEKELTGRLSAVEQARALDPTNEDLYRQSQEIRGILSPVTLAEERDVAIREQMRFKRGEVAKKESEKRAVDAKMKADERAVGRGLDRDEINASIWLFRNETTRSERTADQIAREDRHALALIEIAKQRLGVTLDAEERAHLEFIAREEIRLKTTLTSEDRAEIRTKNRENRGLLKTLAAEKRAVAAAIEAEERRLKGTISAEARAKIAGEVRGDFDDQRAEIRAIAADKRKRVKVFNRITKTEDSITQEMMDDDQNSKTPEYTYDEPETPGKISFVSFVPKKAWAFGSEIYEVGKSYQVTQEMLNNNPDLLDNVTQNSEVVRPGEAKRVEKTPSERAAVPPKQTDAELVSMIKKASAGDLPGILKTAVDSFNSFFTISDAYPETRDAKSALNQLRMVMRVPLVKAMSARGGKFTIEQANKVLPGPNMGDAANISKIRALIPDYRQQLDVAKYIKLNQKVGTDYHVAATKVISAIKYLLPQLEQIVSAWDGRQTAVSGGDIITSQGHRVRRVGAGTRAPRPPAD